MAVLIGVCAAGDEMRLARKEPWIHGMGTGDDAASGETGAGVEAASGAL